MRSGRTWNADADGLPFHFGLAGAMIHGARQHEEQIRQPVHIREQMGLDRIRAKAHDRSLGAAAYRARDVQHGAGAVAAGQNEPAQRRQLGLEPVDPALEALDVGVGDGDVAELIEQLQRDLFALGARLADPRHKIARRVEKIVIDEASITRLEGWIDRLDVELPPLRHFILSDGAAAGAALHFARTVCRRAERAVLSLGKDAVEPVVLTYLNRLSDLLFSLARAANHRAGSPETPW